METQDSPMSDLEKGIMDMLETQFNDENIFNNCMLRKQLKTSNGWVLLDSIVKRTEWLNGLSTKHSIIIAAIEKSPKRFIVVSKDRRRIRRSPAFPLPEDFESRRKDLDLRSVYIKAFKTDTTQKEIDDFMKPYGVYEIEKLYYKRGEFKGAVFACFHSEEEAHLFLELKDLKFNDCPVTKQMKCDYLIESEKVFQQRVLRKKAKYQLRREKRKATERPVKGYTLKFSGLPESTLKRHIVALINLHGLKTSLAYSDGNPEAVMTFEIPIAECVLQQISREDGGVRKTMINGVNVVASLNDGEEEMADRKTVSPAKAACYMRRAPKVIKLGDQDIAQALAGDGSSYDQCFLHDAPGLLGEVPTLVGQPGLLDPAPDMFAGPIYPDGMEEYFRADLLKRLSRKKFRGEKRQMSANEERKLKKRKKNRRIKQMKNREAAKKTF